MSVQGHPLSPQEISRIVVLLTTTELPMTDIARRLGCSKTVVRVVNLRYGIRKKVRVNE